MAEGLVKVAGRRVALTTHALERYCERVRPLAVDQARAELAALLEQCGELLAGGPDWVDSDSDEWFVVLGDDVALPLSPPRSRGGPWIAVSCLTRGLPTARERRSRARHRSSRRARRYAQSRPGRRPLPGAERDWRGLAGA